MTDNFRKPRPMGEPAERKTNVTMPEDQAVNAFTENAEDVAASDGGHIFCAGWDCSFEKYPKEQMTRYRNDWWLCPECAKQYKSKGLL